MSRVLAKASAVRVIRRHARLAGFSELRFEIRARAAAGKCWLFLRRKVGPQPRGGSSERALELLLGSGPSWMAALIRGARCLGAMGERS